MPLILLASFLFGLTAVLPASAPESGDLNIYFKTSPRLELLRPFADPVGMSLLVTGADGRPVHQGFVAIRLDAPRPGRFFSTDFPHVEGTALNEMRLPLRQGRANWNYLLPVRGEYRLVVEAAAADGARASKTFSFRVRENERKWLYFGGFSLALFFLGFFAGRVFTHGLAVVIVGALLLGSAERLLAQRNSAAPGKAALEIGSARVGTPTDVRWHWQKEPGMEKTPALVTLTITHLEKNKVVFGVEKLPAAGEFSMKFQFPDGAEYKVEAAANMAGAPTLRSEQLVSVAASEPPAGAMLPALAYFLGLIALGLAAGRWSKLGKEKSRSEE